MNNVISLDNVSVKYGSNIILEKINLHVKEKEIVSIVGPNGGGKTTLIKTILGFKEHFEGNAKVLNLPPSKISRSGLVGYLPQKQEDNYNVPVSAYDVVAFSRYARKKILERLTSQDREIIEMSLDKTGMLDLANHPFNELSGGQRQRILIARALALKPRLLILDEPSTGLDRVAQDSFYNLLTTLRENENITILLISHDIGAVSVIVDKIACLNRRIHYHGNPKDGIPDNIRERIFGSNINILLHDEHCESCGGDND